MPTESSSSPAAKLCANSAPASKLSANSAPVTPPPTIPQSQLREIIFLHQFWGLGIEIVRDLFLGIIDRRICLIREFMTKADVQKCPISLRNYLVSFCSSLTVLNELSLKLPVKQGVDDHYNQLLRLIIEQYEVIVAVSMERVDFFREDDYETVGTLLREFSLKTSDLIVNQAITLINKHLADIEILKKVIGPDETKAKGFIKKEPFQYIVENLKAIGNELRERYKTEPRFESFTNGVYYLLLQRFHLLLLMLSW